MSQSIHFLPVLVSAAAVFGLGALWYSPLLFGKAWLKVHGYTAETLAAMRATAGRAYAVTFVCYLVMAAAMSILLQRVGVVSALTGIKLGALLGIGIAAPLGLTANVYSDKPLAAWAIDAAYQIAYLMLMGAILAAWR
ncbi:MAG: DUF1761 domain-containing protein [Thermoanaerobaculia bacterium]